MNTFIADRNKILEKLEEIIDPELGVDIVNLGLVYSIEIDESNITILMTMTTPSCPMHTYLTQQTAESVRRLYPWMYINVKLIWDPPWNPEMMSDKAKKMFGR